MTRSTTTRRKNSRPIVIRLGLILICVAIFWGGLVYVVLPLIKAGTPFTQKNFGPTSADLDNYHVYLSISIADQWPLATLTLDEVELPTSMEAVNCAATLIVQAKGAPFDIELLSQTIPATVSFIQKDGKFVGFYGLTPKCTPFPGAMLIMSGLEAFAEYQTDRLMYGAPVRIVRMAHLFPFDRYDFDFTMKAGGITKYPDDRKIPLEVPTSLTTHIEAPRWEKQVYLYQSQGDAYDSIHITIQRPLTLRVLTIALLGLILILILLILAIRDMGNVLQVAVGIFFSLWGVRSVLIPDYITVTTIVNQLILAFYLLLAFIIFVRWAIIPTWQRSGREPNRRYNRSHIKQFPSAKRPSDTQLSPKTQAPALPPTADTTPSAEQSLRTKITAAWRTASATLDDRVRRAKRQLAHLIARFRRQKEQRDHADRSPISRPEPRPPSHRRRSSRRHTLPSKNQQEP